MAPFSYYVHIPMVHCNQNEIVSKGESKVKALERLTGATRFDIAECIYMIAATIATVVVAITLLA